MSCHKRRFSSPEAARKAHRRAGFRVRAYRCRECKYWHVTNTDKGARYGREERRG